MRAALLAALLLATLATPTSAADPACPGAEATAAALGQPERYTVVAACIAISGTVAGQMIEDDDGDWHTFLLLDRQHNHLFGVAPDRWTFIDTEARRPYPARPRFYWVGTRLIVRGPLVEDALRGYRRITPTATYLAD